MSKYKSGNDKATALRIKPEVFDELMAIAEKNERMYSDLVRMMMDRFLVDYKKGKIKWLL